MAGGVGSRGVERERGAMGVIKACGEVMDWVGEGKWGAMCREGTNGDGERAGERMEGRGGITKFTYSVSCTRSKASRGAAGKSLTSLSSKGCT